MRPISNTMRPMRIMACWSQGPIRKFTFLTEWPDARVAWCKTAVSPVLMHRRYCSLAPSHWFKISAITFVFSLQGLPVIQNTLAVLKCQRHSVATIGDHYMWYGEVLEAVAGDTRNAPMLYYLRWVAQIKSMTLIKCDLISIVGLSNSF